MGVYTTEITSDRIPSDNPIHQRLLRPYKELAKKPLGNILEVGCGEGRGTRLLIDHSDKYTAIDKIGAVITKLKAEFPSGNFIEMHIPPFGDLPDNEFDTVVSFQVIEHIKEDIAYLKEINRVLKPGGKAYITTPNINQSLTRNPWHIREYTADELTNIAGEIFSKVRMRGITGNNKVMAYHERNRASVKKITRFDIFNLQYRLPAWLLRIPYDILNRLNRNNLKEANDELVKSITANDYLVVEKGDEALDLFLEVTK